MRVGLTFVLVLGVAFAGALMGPARSAELRLTPENRTALAVTIYGNGLALVNDQRTAGLQAGANQLAFEGVSRELVPSSAVLRAGDSLRIAEIDYDFDLLTPEALLRRSVGQPVKVVRTNPTTGEDTVEDATVLSAEGGTVLRYRDRIEAGVPGRLVFENLPPDLRPFPTLVARVENAVAGDRSIALGYLTNGLTWSADYAVELDEAQKRLSLIGRATVTNNTGATFTDASLALVAGQINRAPAPEPKFMRNAQMAAASPEAAAPAPPTREAFGDLHVYSLERPVDIADRQIKQLALLSRQDVPFTREYVSEAAVATYSVPRGKPEPTHPNVIIQFSTAEGTGPGEPLPAGIARVYGKDSAERLRLLGEDRIDHTPVGETVELSPGRAFDITVTRRQTDFTRPGVSKEVSESAWEIKLTNAKDEPVTVKVVEIISGDWEMISQSAPHEQETAERAVWPVQVPANGSAELSYRVRVNR